MVYAKSLYENVDVVAIHRNIALLSTLIGVFASWAKTLTEH